MHNFVIDFETAKDYMKAFSLDDLKKLVFMIGFAFIIPFLVIKGFSTFYDNATLAEYRRACFYAVGTIGLLFTIMGIALQVNFIGAGFILGGLITLLTGMLYSWADFSSLVQFILLIGLFLLLLGGSYFVTIKSKK